MFQLSFKHRQWRCWSDRRKTGPCPCRCHTEWTE